MWGHNIYWPQSQQRKLKWTALVISVAGGIMCQWSVCTSCPLSSSASTPWTLNLLPRLLPPAGLHCWPGPQLLYCPYLHVCARACVSSCTHTQLMKSKCLDAVVTAVRPSQFLRPEATAGADWSTCERNDTQISELMFSFINCLQQFIKHYLRRAFHSCNWCSACHFLQMRRSCLSLLLLSTHLRFSSQHLYSNYLIIHTDLLFRLCPAHLSH